MLWSCRLSSVDQGILPPPGHVSHEDVLRKLNRQDALIASLNQETQQLREQHWMPAIAQAERDQEGEPLQERQPRSLRRPK